MLNIQKNPMYASLSQVNAKNFLYGWSTYKNQPSVWLKVLWCSDSNCISVKNCYVLMFYLSEGREKVHNRLYFPGQSSKSHLKVNSIVVIGTIQDNYVSNNLLLTKLSHCCCHAIHQQVFGLCFWISCTHCFDFGDFWCRCNWKTNS